jgi:hypothetical protein
LLAFLLSVYFIAQSVNNYIVCAVNGESDLGLQALPRRAKQISIRRLKAQRSFWQLKFSLCIRLD